jgi:hypothetical protein
MTKITKKGQKMTKNRKPKKGQKMTKKGQKRSKNTKKQEFLVKSIQNDKKRGQKGPKSQILWVEVGKSENRPSKHYRKKRNSIKRKREKRSRKQKQDKNQENPKSDKNDQK